MFIFIKTNVLYKALKNPSVLQSQLFIRNFSKKGSSHFGFGWNSSSYCCIDSFKCTKPVLVTTIFLFFLHMQDHDSGWKGPWESSSPSNLLLKAVSWEKDPPYLQSEPPCFNLCPLSFIRLPCTMVKHIACTGMSLTGRIISETTTASAKLLQMLVSRL